MNVLIRAASVLLVLATAYTAYGYRESAKPTQAQALENCIAATYGTTSEAMRHVYGYVPPCI